GLEAFAGRLQGRGPGAVGANIGANKESADRIGDYVRGLEALWGLASYFTINVSSPNTPGLRALQTKAALEELLGRLAEARGRLPRPGGGGRHRVGRRSLPADPRRRVRRPALFGAGLRGARPGAADQARSRGTAARRWLQVGQRGRGRELAARRHVAEVAALH